MPRFVLLHHTFPPGHARTAHYDLMLERGDVLATWSLTELPRSGVDQECDALPPHRLAYLDYEGPVSNDRGEVRRIDAGDYDVVEESSTRVQVVLHGQRLRGAIALTRQENAQRWTLSWSAA